MFFGKVFIVFVVGFASSLNDAERASQPEAEFLDSTATNQTGTEDSTSQAYMESRLRELGVYHEWPEIHRFYIKKGETTHKPKWRSVCLAFWNKPNKSHSVPHCDPTTIKTSCGKSSYTLEFIEIEPPSFYVFVDVLRCDCYCKSEIGVKLNDSKETFFVHKHSPDHYCLFYHSTRSLLIFKYVENKNISSILPPDE